MGCGWVLALTLLPLGHQHLQVQGATSWDKKHSCFVNLKTQPCVFPSLFHGISVCFKLLVNFTVVYPLWTLSQHSFLLKLRYHGQSSTYLLLLAVRGDVSRCRADAAEAMLSVWRAERGKGSKLDTSPRWSCRVWDAISGMSWDMAVEAEEMTSGERALVGEARGGRRGESRTWGLSSARGPLGDAKAWKWRWGV